MSQPLKKDTGFVIKTAILFCVLSAAFSLVGTLLPEKGLSTKNGARLAGMYLQCG